MLFQRSGRLALVVACLTAAAAMAQTTAFTYQGRLVSSGTPAAGSYDFIFRLYDAATVGNLLATVTHTLPVSGGLFTTTLDFTNRYPGAGRWLDISVRPTGGGGYTTLIPRQALTPAPYALGLELPFSGTTNLGATAFSVENDNAAGVAGTSLNGPGVSGTNTGSSSVTSAGVYGVSTAPEGNGVTGIADSGGSAYGVYAEATAGYGVYAYSNTGTGAYASSSSGVGVSASSYTADGVRGESNSGAGVHGIDDSSTFVSAAGVYGEGLASNGNGVTGRADTGSSAYGVFGSAAEGYGVYGTTSSGTGVVGDSNTGAGVHGIDYGSTDTRAAGVVGESTASSGNGVSGICNVGSGAYGVYGESSTGYAGVFSGNVYVGGNLSKAGGSFKIDHPLDPANKYLYHSFVESPDMMNIYNGNVVTDANGYAAITLPDWFETLNRDFRYQLTVIGQFAQAIVTDEIQGNQFAIATDKPNVKVSWQVTGIRQDPWANAYRIPVEEPKSNLERGLYLHPELYGQSSDLGMQTAKARAAALAQPVDAPALPLGKGPSAPASTPSVSQGNPVK